MKKIVIILSALLVLGGCSSAEIGQREEETIHVYTRDASSGTREAFEKAIGLVDLADTAIEVTSNGDMATKVGSDEEGIGYVSLSTDFDAYNLKALSFEGIEPSLETILDGSYAMQRPFSYVSRSSGDFTSNEKELLILAFIDFLCNSTEGKLAIQSAGVVVDLSEGESWMSLSENHPIVNQDNSSITIKTAGSTSVSKSLQAALEMFQPMAGNFDFVMNQTGSSDGYKRVLGSEKDGANAADIGFTSRDFKVDEDVEVAMVQGVYCVDAVVAVVHKENPLSNLTKEQLRSIYSGDIIVFE